MATKTKLEKRVKEIMETCEKEIMSSEIAIPFYEKELTLITNDGEKAKVELKIKQIKDSMEFNKRFLEHLKQY